MPDYAKTARAAALKIAAAGQVATLRRVVLGEYDTDTGKPAVLSDTSYTCYVALFDYSLQGSGISNEPGSLIQAGDKQILLPAYGLAITPAPGDTLIVGGVTWNIKNVKELNPAGVPILYDLNGRK